MKFKLQQQQFHLPIGKLLLIVDTGTSEGSIITFIQNTNWGNSYNIKTQRHDCN